MIHTTVCVIGGGPAGSTIAMRLAQLGHAVVLTEKAVFPRPHIGESITPDILALLEVLGIRRLVEARGYLRPHRTILRWGGETTLVNTDAPGFQVLRSDFDQLLLQQAAANRVTILQPFGVIALDRKDSGHWLVRGHRLSIITDYVVLATGRANPLRRSPKRSSAPMLALYAYWESGACGQDTRVEAGPEEWFWGAPLPDGSFNATVFVDPAAMRHQETNREKIYKRLVARSALLREISQGRRLTAVRSCDATCFHSLLPLDDTLLLVGEASFSLDPLSSQGVRSAMGSALHGAIALNTLIRRPHHAHEASQFVQMRQQEAVAYHSQWAAERYAQAASQFGTCFWRERARIAIPQADQPPTIPITLKRDSLLQLASGTQVVKMPCVEGNFVVPGRAVQSPRLRRPIAYLGGLSLPMLLDHLESPRTPSSLLSTWAKLAGCNKAAELLEAVLRLELIVPVGRRSHQQLR